jgi:hypothetical protein
MPVVASKPSAVAAVSPSAEREIRRIVCSAPWFDACRAALASGRVRATKQVAVCLDRGGLFPPGSSKVASRGRPGTLMRRCANCGSRWYPPQYISSTSGVCQDCAAAADVPYSDERTHVSSTHSPSAAAIHALALRRERLVELRLEADDEASLRAEIAAHSKRSKVAC